MSDILEARDVAFVIGGKKILDGVSLCVRGGESVALVGPNGAGKSTLLRLLSGDLRASRGAVMLKGRPIASYAPAALAHHRAVQSQSVAVAFPFTVAEIVAMGAGDARGRDVAALVDRALAAVDLAGFADRVITTLSGGEQQRAHFARVLVQNAYGEAHDAPGVLLLDEPTASLDLRHQLTVAKAVRRRVAEGSAVVSVLHDLNLASMFADRVIVLSAGRVVCDGAPSEVITNEMVERVFGVGDCVRVWPGMTVPVVLPRFTVA